MDRELVEDFRHLMAPGEDKALLSLQQTISVHQAFGLSLELPSATVAVQAQGDYVLLWAGNAVTMIKPRTEWRDVLERWHPQPIFPVKE